MVPERPGFLRRDSRFQKNYQSILVWISLSWKGSESKRISTQHNARKFTFIENHFKSRKWLLRIMKGFSGFEPSKESTSLKNISFINAR